MQIHVVQWGNTLWAISQRYSVTINQIVTANQLEDPNKYHFYSFTRPIDNPCPTGKLIDCKFGSLAIR